MATNKLDADLKRVKAACAKGKTVLKDVEPMIRGVTPREAVYSDNKLTLYRYEPMGERRPGPPLLIVYALVNRPYMMDIQEDRSVIRGMLELGLPVYLIDWGYPDENDTGLSLDDYINRYIDDCVDHIRSADGCDQVNLLGVCQGGAFSLCYTALHPEKIRNLITMITPVDFHTPENLLSKWAQEMDIDAAVDHYGNFPGDLLNWTYMALRPFRQTAQKYYALADVIARPALLENFLRMEQWIFDTPDQAGQAFREFSKQFFQQNRLVKGETEIGDQRVDLGAIKCPVLNIYAEDDHLIPPSASKPLAEHVGSQDYTELAFKGGHIGIYTSARSRETIPPAIVDWLSARSVS